MVIAERYAELWKRLHEMREAWLELRITVREDRPRGEATMLVESIGDDVDDGVAAIEEAVGAVADALQNPEDLRAGGRALGAVHSRLTQAGDRYWLGVASRRRELQSLARRHGAEWGAWARSVEDAHGHLPAGLTAAHEELRHAWMDLVERATGSTSATANTELRGR